MIIIYNNSNIRNKTCKKEQVQNIKNYITLIGHFVRDTRSTACLPKYQINQSHRITSMHYKFGQNNLLKTDIQSFNGCLLV